MHKRLGLKCVRQFCTVPSHTNYYQLVVDDLDAVLGPKRVESSRVEATMRRIAQKLFLYEDAQRALLEQEIKNDETQFVRGRNLQYLRDFVDARDMAPRPLPSSQRMVSKKLRDVLQANRSQLVTEVAEIIWKYPIRRRSTYQMVAREMLKLGYGKAAQHIMESLLMATKRKGSEASQEESEGNFEGNASNLATSAAPDLLGNSAYTLCLELAMANNDHSWFLELSKASSSSPSTSSLRPKFDLDLQDPVLTFMLAEGFMKFGHPHLLDELLNRNRDRPFYVKLLAVSMEMAVRFNDEARAKWTFSEFLRRFDPSRTATVQFLLLARKHAATKSLALDLVPKLSPKKQKLYHLKESSRQYPHSYAA